MITAPERTATTQASVKTRKSLWARLGAAAFLFFLVKGLLWLAVPAVVAVLAAKD